MTDTTTKSTTTRRPKPNASFTLTNRSPEELKKANKLGSVFVPNEVVRKRLDLGADDDPGDLYCLHIEGNCLEPEAHHNDLVIAAPAQPIRQGDLVVLYFKGGRQPWIKRVVMAPMPGWERLSADSEIAALIDVEQLNPPQCYRIPTDRLSAIHRVAMAFRPGEFERIPSKRQARRARVPA